MEIGTSNAASEVKTSLWKVAAKIFIMFSGIGGSGKIFLADTSLHGVYLVSGIEDKVYISLIGEASSSPPPLLEELRYALPSHCTKLNVLSYIA
eukprot:Gb_01447 [translate_table: standard]